VPYGEQRMDDALYLYILFAQLQSCVSLADLHCAPSDQEGLLTQLTPVVCTVC